MNTKALFPCGGGSNLILGTGMENQIFILRTPATIKFFHQILKNCHFGVKKKSLPTQMDLYHPYMVPHTIYSKNSSCYQIFSSNSQKLSLWCKKKSLSMQMDLYDPYKSPHTISYGNFNFPRSTNKIQFLTKFPHLEKNGQFNESPQI